jgi:Xaa-Pro aminopeptidase
MQYSPLNDVPYVGLVDAGTIELVRSVGAEVVSSADLVQLFEARWSAEALASHVEAGKVIHESIRHAFRTIRKAALASSDLSEYAVQQELLRFMSERGVVTDEPPIVAVNANTASPHYLPTQASSLPIRANDFVLLDVWGKLQKPGSVYFDITWTGYVGKQVPAPYQDIFSLVREARDAAIACVRHALETDQELRGYEVDDAAREVIRKAGYADHFVHRTGHSIGEEVHGNGANMDNYESRDIRRVLPGTCFSIEPGIYLKDFGMRSEVNVYAEMRGARVTGQIQQAVVPILAPES